MKLSVDGKQRITTTCLMFLEFYKILMATFLVLFVPQKCESEVCSVTQNFYRRDSVHFAALLSNFITFVSVLYFYFVELIFFLKLCLCVFDKSRQSCIHHLFQQQILQIQEG